MSDEPPRGNDWEKALEGEATEGDNLSPLIERMNIDGSEDTPLPQQDQQPLPGPSSALAGTSVIAGTVEPASSDIPLPVVSAQQQVIPVQTQALDLRIRHVTSTEEAVVTPIAVPAIRAQPLSSPPTTTRLFRGRPKSGSTSQCSTTLTCEWCMNSIRKEGCEEWNPDSVRKLDPDDPTVPLLCKFCDGKREIALKGDTTEAPAAPKGKLVPLPSSCAYDHILLRGRPSRHQSGWEVSTNAKVTKPNAARTKGTRKSTAKEKVTSLTAEAPVPFESTTTSPFWHTPSGERHGAHQYKTSKTASATATQPCSSGFGQYEPRYYVQCRPESRHQAHADGQQVQPEQYPSANTAMGNVAESTRKRRMGTSHMESLTLATSSRTPPDYLSIHRDTYHNFNSNPNRDYRQYHRQQDMETYSMSPHHLGELSRESRPRYQVEHRPQQVTSTNLVPMPIALNTPPLKSIPRNHTDEMFSFGLTFQREFQNNLVAGSQTGHSFQDLSPYYHHMAPFVPLQWQQARLRLHDNDWTGELRQADYSSDNVFEETPSSTAGATRPYCTVTTSSMNATSSPAGSSGPGNLLPYQQGSSTNNGETGRASAFAVSSSYRAQESREELNRQGRNSGGGTNDAAAAVNNLIRIPIPRRSHSAVGAPEPEQNEQRHPENYHQNRQGQQGNVLEQHQRMGANGRENNVEAAENIQNALADVVNAYRRTMSRNEYHLCQVLVSVRSDHTKGRHRPPPPIIKPRDFPPSLRYNRMTERTLLRRHPDETRTGIQLVRRTKVPKEPQTSKSKSQAEKANAKEDTGASNPIVRDDIPRTSGLSVTPSQKEPADPIVEAPNSSEDEETDASTEEVDSSDADMDKEDGK